MSFNCKCIQRTLNLLEKKYDEAMRSTRASATLEAQLYSKLALLELCGWVEETVDIILTNYITQKVKNAHLQETIIGEVILPVYGFNYSKHLKPLLDKILGAANAQKMMLRLALRDGRDCRLKAIFGSLSRARDRAAHTHWHGTPCFAAPSSIINDFKNMRPILRSMERIINNMSLREY